MSDGVKKLGYVPEGQEAQHPRPETQAEVLARQRARKEAEIKRLMALAPEDPTGAASAILSRTDIVNSALIMVAAKQMGVAGDSLRLLAEAVMLEASEEAKPLVAAIQAAEMARHAAARKTRDADAKAEEASRIAREAQAAAAKAKSLQAEAEKLTAEASALTAPAAEPEKKGGKK